MLSNFKSVIILSINYQFLIFIIITDRIGLHSVPLSLQMHRYVDHIKKPMKVINSTSYPLSMGFTFSVLPMLMERRLTVLHWTVSDKIVESTGNQLGTLKALFAAS